MKSKLKGPVAGTLNPKATRNSCWDMESGLFCATYVSSVIFLYIYIE